MGKPEAAYKKKEARKSPVGLAVVGKFQPHLPSTSRRSAIHGHDHSIELLQFVVHFSLREMDRCADSGAYSATDIRGHRAAVDRTIQAVTVSLRIVDGHVGKDWIGLSVNAYIGGNTATTTEINPCWVAERSSSECMLRR